MAIEALGELTDRISDWLVVTDTLGTVLWMNRAAAAALGSSGQDQSIQLLERVAPENRDKLQAFLENECAGAPVTVAMISVDGRRSDVELTRLPHPARPGRIEMIGRDYTLQHRLEDQLRQTQKREAVGILAGGIAHDFNNLLTGILGYADLLKLEAKPGEHIHEALSVIQKAAEQAVRLTTQLLSYTRRGKQEHSAVDAHEVIREVTELLERTIDKKIRIELSLDATEFKVLGDSGQLHQVLLNLALNAKDAMPDGGRLAFRTEIREPSIEMPLDSLPHFVVTVSDTGTGIAPDLQDRIFEPFFTTKEPGSGSGMGLAMVNGIVKEHGGLVRMRSTLGEGTAFTLYLPLATTGEIEKKPSPVLPASGRGKVLLVDDEEIVRQVGSRMLEGLGYAVLTMHDGGEAIRYFSNHSDEIDLVILDMVMPSLNGRDCLIAMRMIDPQVRVVLTSGYGQDGAAQEIISQGLAGFLQKPYQLSTLADIIGNAMQRPQITAV